MRHSATAPLGCLQSDSAYLWAAITACEKREVSGFSTVKFVKLGSVKFGEVWLGSVRFGLVPLGSVKFG